MSEYAKALRDASDALVVQFQRRGGRADGCGRYTPVEVAANTPAKSYVELAV
jgi:hypothetical protein